MADFFSPLSLVGAPVRRLTKMYSDTKKSYETVAAPPEIKIPEDMGSLHRKLRIQKDRLITWGLDWSDGNAAEPGDIDESLEQAGLSDVVGSILANIQGLLEEAEHLGSTSSMEAKATWEKRGNADEPKSKWNTFNKAKFEDLIKDLTTSIDTLHDLSRTRRAMRRGGSLPGKAAPYAYKDPARPPSATPSSTLSSSHKVADLPPSLPPTPRDIPSDASLRLDRESLVVSTARICVPSSVPSGTPLPTTRAMGYLRRPHTSTNPWKRDGNRVPTIPVLIEYANYDSTYSSTGIFLPLDHLHELATTLHWPEIPQEPHVTGTLNLLGFFEEEAESRYGMVYELPRDVYHGPQDSDVTLESVSPVTLQSILKGGPRSITVVPCLEDRFRAAYNITFSVAHLFLSGLVHGNLSSENVIMFPKVNYSDDVYEHRDLRSPYLSCFDVFSEYDIEIGHSDDDSHLVYQHPLKASTARPSRAFSAFDLYSLGLILLELGLWMPIRTLRKDGYDAETFKSRLQGPYTKALLPKCGRLYMRTVQTCLMAPEELDPLDLEHERHMTRRYQDNLQKLKTCCSIDEVSESLDEESYENTLPLGRIQRQKSTKSVHYMDSLPEYHDDSTNRDDESMEDYTADTTPIAPTTRDPFVPMTPVSDFEMPINPRRPSPISPKPPKARLRVHPLKLSPQDLDLWHDSLLPKLEKILTKTLKESNETVTIDLINIGETPILAKNTIMVTCTSVNKVKSLLKRRFKPNSVPFEFKVRRGKLHRSSGRERGIKRALSRRSSRGVRKKRGAIHRSSGGGEYDEAVPMNPFHQPRPLCGASIGAYKNEEHLPPVSFGGVILLDGEPYGMTVHHILEEESDPEDDSDDEEDDFPTRSSARWYGQQQMPGFENESPWMPSSNLETFSYEISDDDTTYDSGEDFMDSGLEENSDFDDDEMSDEDDYGVCFGDTPGVRKGEGGQFIITQPAIDDVSDEFFHKEEDRDEDHLDSHTFGCIHASSGVRRVKKDGIIHEIDWALVRIDDERLQPHNLIQGGRRYSKQGGAAAPPSLVEPVDRSEDYAAAEDLYPTAIADGDDLGSMQVHCMGRTSGLMGGVISPAMSSLRVFGRKSYSRSWQVMGGFGVGGDSGAWVIDNKDGSVCGHVLAWCDKNCVAYICPMDVLLEDITRTLRAGSVALPGGEVSYNDSDPLDLESLHISREPSRRSTRNEKVEKDLQKGISEKDVQDFKELMYRTQESRLGLESLKASS
ncbi:MAG: hypothetical protein M1814_006531 [Vezdaea aestivalis]|nr:MAG: hypothetical protein M1814_006531 [Vezdaea aestivalis]